MAVDRKRTLARVGMFVGLVGVECYLASSMSSAPSIRGYIETKSYGVSSSAKGVIRKIDVSLGQHVIAGQVIAELDGASVEAEMAVAMAERKKLVAGARVGSADANDEALLVVDRTLEQLAGKRDGFRLKAPADGIIESIDARPGDAVGADSPVATIVASDTRRVIACIPELRIAEVEIGSTAEITSAVGGQHLAGTVESLTPAIATLPPRCQAVVAKPAAFGRLAVVLLDKPADELPGESQLIAFGARGKIVPVPDPQIEHVAAPTLIDVPPEIVAVSAFEASGLVWIKSLHRYIVISDETGRDGRHSPWLFTMSQRGVVDPEPLVVSDVDALDDIESIAAGDQDALWVLASQSVSEKGKRPRARSLLAHLVPDGVAYRADQQMHLVELLEAAPEAVRVALGVSDTKQLDIEGMAYRGGALYFGLKAPGDLQGRAIIWRVALPDKLLAGDLIGAGITLWGAVAIPIEVDGHPFQGGIADMMFISDTRLIVGATASGISAKHQNGAVYTLDRAGTELHATKLQTFRDLKPEGVAVAPEPGRITVVFDRGRDAPMWTQLEIPSGDL